MINENDIGVFIHNGKILVKRYRKFGDKIYLYSDNPNYPPSEIRREDTLSVYAKIIWVMNKE